MIIYYVKWRNIGPFGNEEQRINFTKEATLHQIIGKNGVGKSTIIRILKIVLYQEYDGINVAQIANQVNKNGYIEVNVDSKGNNWKIINEFSPNKVRVYKNGNPEPEDWGKLADTKSQIKSQIVDMPYYIFNNAISLSLDDFKSFLSMNAADSRNIRDRIFGFYVVNEMMELMKPEMNKYIAEIDQFKSKIENIDQSIETSQTEYDELKEKIKEGSQDEINRINDEIIKLKKELGDYNIEKEKHDKKVADIKLHIDYLINLSRKNKLEEMTTKLDKLTDEVDTVEKDRNIKISEKEELDGEKQLITGKVTLQRIDELGIKITEYQSKSEELESEKSEIEYNIIVLEELVEKFSASADLIKNRDLLKVNAEQLSTLNSQHKEILESLEKGENYLKEVENKLEEGDNKQSEKTILIDGLKKKILAHEQGTCSECGTDLTGDEHIKRYDGYKADLELEVGKEKIISEMLNKLQDSKIKASEKIDELERIKHDTYAKYSDIKVSISGVEGFDDTKKILLNTISHTNHDFISEWKMENFEKLLKCVEIPDSDYNIEADKNKLEEEKDLFEEKYQEIKGLEVSKRGDITRMDTLKEGLKEGVTKEKLNKTKFSLDSEEAYNEKLKKLSEEIDGLGTAIRSNERDIGETKAKVELMKKEIKPDSDFEQLGEVDVSNIEKNLDNLNENINDATLKVRKVGENIESVNQYLSNKEITIKSLLSDEHVETQLKSVQSIIDKFKEELEQFNTDIEKSRKHVNFFKTIQYILSDEGIKSYILKDVVPPINSEIAKILEMLGVPLTIMFDEEFDVHIYRFGEEVSLNTISTGQKKMTNCAIILSITIILRMKYYFNVTFYDEILSSIDSDNRPILLEIIKEICCSKLKLHTFVMNHDYIPSSYFDYVVSVIHKNNFSSINILTQDQHESQYLLTNKKGDNKLVEDLIVETLS